MTEQQRRFLAERIEQLLRKEWGSEFRDGDAIRIYDYCMDEATTNDVQNEAMQFEMKYA